MAASSSMHCVCQSSKKKQEEYIYYCFHMEISITFFKDTITFTVLCKRRQQKYLCDDFLLLMTKWHALLQDVLLSLFIIKYPIIKSLKPGHCCKVSMNHVCPQVWSCRLSWRFSGSTSCSTVCVMATTRCLRLLEAPLSRSSRTWTLSTPYWR